jgi:hypothetical protein
MDRRRQDPPPVCWSRFRNTVLVAVGLLMVSWSQAAAIPSFARQTGFDCTACHTAFPELTPLGRVFKLNGYVFTSGGAYVPPLAAELQASFSHTEAGQPGGAAPHFHANDNFALQQASLFYGGKIVSHLGAFAQVTYDDVAKRTAIDNTDIRFANTARLGGAPLTYGFTLNNNPTVQDVWNSTPAWGFPFASSSLAPTPAASTLLEGAFAQQVGGLGGYVWWNDLLYGEASAYKFIPKRVQKAFGLDTSGENKLDGTAPYWRLALQENWGVHSLEVGTYGLLAHLFPGSDQSAGSDHLSDVAFDAQYQYLATPHILSFQMTWIHEDQELRASQALGLADNAVDILQSFRAKASYLYDSMYGFTLSYFTVYGTSDAGLYQPAPISGSRTGSPDSHGWIVELDYLPLSKRPLGFWPWFRAKLSVQYVLYDRFNGAGHNYDGFGRNASDNNTLFLLAWLDF